MSGHADVAMTRGFVDFDGELAFWREQFSRYPFFQPGLEFADYAPAFKLGINMFLHGRGRGFDEHSAQVIEAYDRTRGESRLDWHEACAAAVAAWRRMRENPSRPDPLDASRRLGGESVS